MLSMPGMVIGTVPYMSPEQVRGEELDCRSDFFSFGSVLYELFSGRRPFEAKSPAEVISAILTAEPAPISRPNSIQIGDSEDRLVRKCLAKDKTQRYQAMGDLISELSEIRREHESGQLRPISGPTATTLVANLSANAADSAGQEWSNWFWSPSYWRLRWLCMSCHLGSKSPPFLPERRPPMQRPTTPTCTAE